jgi:hypothetical protein
LIEVVDMKLEDLLAIARKLPPAEREVFEAFTGENYSPEQAAMNAFCSPGIGWVIQDPVKPVAAGGFARIRDGVFATWFLATDAAWHEHGREVTECVAERISAMLAPGLAHRIETVTLADRSRARDWYTKIGLRFESTLPGYGVRGEEAVRYVAVRDVEKT